jgi:hypothetical protein
MRPKALAPTLCVPALLFATPAKAPMRAVRHRVRDLIATGVILLLIPAILVPRLAVRAVGALINLAPAEAPAGAKVSVAGTGFAVGQRVAIVLDAVGQLAGLRADRAGSLSVTVVVPAMHSPAGIVSMPSRW